MTRMLRGALVAGAAALLVAVTVLVFRAFDAHSHSASDTLRPFALAMTPVWLGAIAVARALRRRSR